MTDNEAIEFLKTVQPLPDDSELSEELIERFDEVRRHFVKSPNELAVPLLLNSFGKGDGFGVYQLVEDAIAGVSPPTVVVHLLNAMASSNSSVRYWATQISATYNDPQLVAPLINLLRDESDDTRAAALISIEKYVNKTMVDELRELRIQESSRDVQAMYDDIISSVK